MPSWPGPGRVTSFHSTIPRPIPRQQRAVFPIGNGEPEKQWFRERLSQAAMLSHVFDFAPRESRGRGPAGVRVKTEEKRHFTHVSVSVFSDRSETPRPSLDHDLCSASPSKREHRRNPDNPWAVFRPPFICGFCDLPQEVHAICHHRALVLDCGPCGWSHPNGLSPVRDHPLIKFVARRRLEMEYYHNTRCATLIRV